MAIESYLKSSFDAILSGIAASQSLRYIDLDDMATDRLLQESNDPLLVGKYRQSVSEGKLFTRGSLSVGIKILNDPGNYQILRGLEAVQNVLFEGKRFDIRDYTGFIAAGSIGSCRITKVALQDTTLMHNANLRFIDFEFIAHEFV